MRSHIFLTGFMGAGKSSVGFALAQALTLPFVDLDNLIVDAAGKSIKSIFSDAGESVFRDYESRCLNRLLNTTKSIVSTGGGIVGRIENRIFMQDNGTTVYLSAEWPTLQQRLDGSADRPLADSGGNWATTKTLFLERCPLYEQADLVIKTDQRTVQEIVDEIRNHTKL